MALDTIKKILADLIAFDTVSSNSNLLMIEYLAEHFQKLGAHIEYIHDESGKKANLFATLGPQVSGGIVLSGHTDVVPVAEQKWHSDPFNALEQDGKLYGRGSCDMKGFIAVACAMAPTFQSQIRDKPLHFSFTYDEETGCFGAKRLKDVLSGWSMKPALAIIGEPTNMRLVEGHKGCNEYRTVFEGLPGHSSLPDQGVNALEYAVMYVSHLLHVRDQLKDTCPDSSHFDPPQTTINIGKINGGVAHNVIASQAVLDWQVRPISQLDAEMVKTEMAAYCERELLPMMRAIHPDANIWTEILSKIDGLEPKPDNAAKQLMQVLMDDQDAGLVCFATEGGIFQTMGMDCIVCGPGSIEQAHRADEFVTLEQLESCQRCLQNLSGKLAAASC